MHIKTAGVRECPLLRLDSPRKMRFMFMLVVPIAARVSKKFVTIVSVVGFMIFREVTLVVFVGLGMKRSTSCMCFKRYTYRFRYWLTA